MDKEIFSVPLRSRSGDSGYACRDGEVDGMVNLRMSGGALVGLSPGGVLQSPGGVAPVEGGVLQTPPPPAVEFALRQGVVEGWHIHPDMLPSRVVEAPTGGKDFTPGEGDWGERAMTLLTAFEEDARRGNLFTQPFFAMAAYRLADGTHLCPSPPMLMIPNSGALMVEGSSDFTVPTMKMSVVAAACRLQWRVSMPEIPQRWEGVVTHLDVFISMPVPLYDRKGGMTGFHREECTNFTHSIGADGVAGERRVKEGSMVQCWRTRPVDAATVASAVAGTAVFHLVGEMPLGVLESQPEAFSDVPFNRGGLTIMGTLEEYRPDYAHLWEVTVKGSACFSGRVTAWGLSMIPLAPYPLSLSAPYAGASGVLPRWVFVPDPDAREYRLTSGGREYALPLRKHRSLRGAFYFGGFSPDAATIGAGAVAGNNSDEGYATADEDAARRAVEMPGWIWRSEAGGCGESCNRWLFPDFLLMRLDVGEVLAVCRAFRASGLVATTSPTAYCFTTEGVFLLKEMDDGTFRDAGLICAYRLSEGTFPELLPKGVRFVTDSGVTVTIEGTKVTADGGDSGDGGEASESGAWKDFIPEEWGFSDPGFGPGGEWGAFVTRPLKLTGAETWKQPGSVELRGSYGEVAMALYGSADLRSWEKIAEAGRGCVSGLWAPRVRFLRVAVKVRAIGPVSIEGFAVSLV